MDGDVFLLLSSTWTNWWKYGSALDLDFANSRGFNSATPNKTTPDSILTYTAPSVKMVYGSDGVLGFAPHNFLLQSQTFNTTWSLGSNSVTDNQDVAPDGTTTADLVTMVVASGVFQTIAVTASTTYTFSFWAKRGTKTNLQYRVYNNTGAANITAPTSYYSSTSAGAFSRITHTFTTPAGCISIRVYIDDSNDGTSGTFLVWGAQVNRGSSALTYLPTTTAAVYSLPIDYNPTTFASLGVLIEEQRVNLLTYSEQFDNAAWAKDQTTISANAVASPDGTTTADKLVENTSNSAHRAYQSITLTAASYTYSVYAKAAERTWLTLRLDPGTDQYAYFDLANGALGSVNAAYTASITSVGGGWYRCTISRTATAVSYLPLVGLATGNNGAGYLGNGTSGLYLWGAQLEAGAFATSYIPTVASQSTRLADNVSILTSAFGYSATAGTMSFEGDWRGSNGGLYAFGQLATNAANYLLVYANNSAQSVQFSVINGGVFQADLGGMGTQVAGANVKAAVAWAANDFAGRSNGGGGLRTDGAGTIPTVTNLHIGSYLGSAFFLNGHIKRLTYFPTRKDNASLQLLSAS